MSENDALLGEAGVAVKAPPARGDADVGLVLKWRRRGDSWEGLVTRELPDGQLVTEWLVALVLAPLDPTATD